MSWSQPIDAFLVQEVIDDLEDSNAHTLCDLLRGTYGLPGRVPDEVYTKAYDAAKAVLWEYRMEKFSVVAK